MSANTHTTETTTERKPPTIADIVREKTGDGALIIDFFTDVMTGRIDGAELCHRIDAAKQLVKYGSKDAAEFLAKYKGVPCGHSINGRPNQADPCSAAERSLVAVTLNAPATLTRDFLTVLSGIDEFLMARLIRAQTVDAGTIIEFLDDVMQDRTDGFKTHHRIAAAKELIVHIVRDEHPAPTPREPEPSSTVIPAKAGIQGDGGRSTVANPAHPEPRETVVPAKSLPRTRYGAGTQGRGVARPSEVGAHAELNSPVVPAKAGTHPRTVAMGEPATEQPGADTQPPNPDPRQRTPGRQSKTAPRTTHPNTATPGRKRQGRRSPNGLRAQQRGKERRKPAPVELTIAERRIKEKLKQHWHEPDPWPGPIDSTTPGRSPPVTATRLHN